MTEIALDFEGELGSNYLGMSDLGKYQFIVQDVDVRDGEFREVVKDGVTQTLPESMVVKLTVVAPEEKRGKMHTMYLPKSGRGAKQTLMFAIATGLTTLEKYEASTKAGAASLQIPFEHAAGATMLAEVEKDSWNGQDRAKVKWKMFPVGDPRAKDFPIDRSLEDDDESLI